jgi:hypothetical protein
MCLEQGCLALQDVLERMHPVADIVISLVVACSVTAPDMRQLTGNVRCAGSQVGRNSTKPGSHVDYNQIGQLASGLENMEFFPDPRSKTVPHAKSPDKTDSVSFHGAWLHMYSTESLLPLYGVQLVEL